ncbi:YccT family protein [Desulfobacula phenolica]|uniref:DUF2057 domain-containing protein n=1 Tax=Desulfobacula phenolica TaxID=90732 RepID=A0A1H2EHF3_9BACT|nr:DUF2057 domain-containing protein [Desulfobacula phenolica]SDT94413.1 hypothetical protein SAMN04487931_103111 [Desulfobacula phenolica]
MMKKFRTGLLLILICIASSAWADVALMLPENINLIAVNGKKTKNLSEVILMDGVNQIAVQFLDEFGRNNESEIEYSEIFVIKFRAQNQTLHLKTPHIADKHDVKKLNDTPEFYILNNSNHVIQIHVDTLKKEGLQLMRDYEQELCLFNKSHSSAAATFSQKKTRYTETVPPNNSPNVKKATHSKVKTNCQQIDQETYSMSSDVAETMLKYWYGQADEQSRRNFREWLKCSNF